MQPHQRRSVSSEHPSGDNRGGGMAADQRNARTVSTSSKRSSTNDSMRVGTTFRRWETPVFVAATLVALLHALDDAFLNRQPGVPLGQHALAALISVAAAAAAIVAFPRSRPGVRAAIALVFGVLALVNGALHLVHVTDVETSGSDVTGLLAVAAGITLLVLGLAIPFLHRGEGARTGARRWAIPVAVVVGGALIVYAFLFPIERGDRADAQVPRADRRSAVRRLRAGLLHRHRRARALGLVPPFPQPRSRRARARRRGRPHRRCPTRRAPRAPRVRRPPLRLPRPRRERGQPRRVRLGLGRRTSGARSRSSANARTSTRSGSAGSGCPPEPTSSSRSPPSSAT